MFTLCDRYGIKLHIGDRLLFIHRDSNISREVIVVAMHVGDDPFLCTVHLEGTGSLSNSLTVLHASAACSTLISSNQKILMDWLESFVSDRLIKSDKYQYM